MLAQGALGFQYAAEGSSTGPTSLAGLPLYLDLVKATGLGAAIREHVCVAGSQGWLDIQMVLALVFLNLAGGDCMEDLERLENDAGFSTVLRAIEQELLSRAEQRSLPARWRRTRRRAQCLRHRRHRSGWSGSTTRRHRKRLPARRSFRPLQRLCDGYGR